MPSDAPVSHETLGTLSYPYWLRVTEPQLSADHTTTASLNELLFAEAGEFRLRSKSAHALVQTGPDSGAQGRERCFGGGALGDHDGISRAAGRGMAAMIAGSQSLSEIGQPAKRKNWRRAWGTVTFARATRELAATETRPTPIRSSSTTTSRHCFRTPQAAARAETI